MRKLLARMLGISELERRVNELEYTVDQHEGEIAVLRSRTKSPKPCSAVFSPYANAYRDCHDCGWPLVSHTG